MSHFSFLPHDNEGADNQQLLTKILTIFLRSVLRLLRSKKVWITFTVHQHDQINECKNFVRSFMNPQTFVR
jgi:hypothetical protein